MPDDLLTCVIRSVVKKETTPKKEGDKPKPYVVVVVNGYLKTSEGSVNNAFCYDTALFDALLSGVNKECQIKIDSKGKFIKVLDVFFVDGVEHVGGKPVAPTTDDGIPIDDEIPF
jgi:hypothetical protein